MLKSKYLLLVLGLALIACKKEKLDHYTINGTINGVKDGTKVVLSLQHPEFFLGLRKKVADTTTIQNGQFTFTGKLENPTLYHIVLVEPEKKRFESLVIPVFFENETIKISTKKEAISTLSNLYNGTYNFDAIKLEGAKIHLTYVDYLKDMSRVQLKEGKLWDENLKNFKEKRKLSVSQGIEFANRFEVVWKEKNEFSFNFVKNNINSTLGQFVGYLSTVMSPAKYTKEQLNEINSLIPENANGFPGIKVLKDHIVAYEKIAPGSQYIDLPFKDKDGNNTKLSNHVGKGKYILLEFWASWCGPCRMDIPHLKDIYKLYSSENFDIISISMDSSHENWQKAINEEQMPWLQVSDGEDFNGDLARKYKIQGIPACFLIDPNGIIVTNNMRGSYMDKRLIEMYGNKFGDKY
ncbi:thioredoxin-like domain-containing protein [Algibacter sp. Ld11]|uniref:thioredoxin-like domain-containing protein n=1 Tax=Algibacter sp. Ld11 TaxID=649150 RepID=UPI0038691621